MIPYVTIRYPTFYIKVDGRDTICDILGDTKLPYLYYN